MADDKQQKPTQETKEQKSERQDSGLRKGIAGAKDGELREAYGLRPTPPPIDTDTSPGTSQPINKAADLTEKAREFAANDSGKKASTRPDRPTTEPSKDEKN